MYSQNFFFLFQNKNLINNKQNLDNNEKITSSYNISFS